MTDLELRELTYFVAVAEELNFSRAAERLGMAQPPLSRAVRQMERRLGVQLFERNTRRVTLTAAGLTLLDEAPRVFDAMSAAVHRTARAASASPTLVVTAKPGAPMDLLRRIVNSYTALPGTSRVEIVVSGYRQQAKMVREGHADVALLSSPYDERGLDTHPLITEPRVAALPVGHDLAHRDILRCRDLHGEPIPQWPESDPTERAYWSGRDRDFLTNGHIESQPDLSEHGPVVSDITQLLEVVQLGQAVALIPRFLAESNPRVGIAYRPVVDASPYTLVIVWAKGSRARSIFAFVSTAITLTAHDESGNNDLPIEPEGSRATRDSREYSRNRSS